MITTKHDLCANTAKLNLNELIETAKIAVSRSRWDCEKALRNVQERQLENSSDGNFDKWRASYHVASAACELAESAKALASATNTLHYLLNAQDREIIIVDKK
jgi:hypothetical protein